MTGRRNLRSGNGYSLRRRSSSATPFQQAGVEEQHNQGRRSKRRANIRGLTSTAHLRTPTTTHPNDNDDGEEVTVYNPSPSDLADTEDRNLDATVHLPLEDLPDVPPISGKSQAHSSQQSSPEAQPGRTRRTTVEMATAEQLGARDVAPTSTGKLKRPSTSNANPPYRNPAAQGTTKTRKLRASTAQARPDAYDLEGSPGRTRRPMRKPLGSDVPISPLKKDKRRAKGMPTPMFPVVDPWAKDQQRVDAQLSQEAGLTTDGPSDTVACQNCGTTTARVWRRRDTGDELCQNCGQYFRRHGRHRTPATARSRFRPSPSTLSSPRRSQRPHGTVEVEEEVSTEAASARSGAVQAVFVGNVSIDTQDARTKTWFPVREAQDHVLAQNTALAGREVRNSVAQMGEGEDRAQTKSMQQESTAAARALEAQKRKKRSSNLAQYNTHRQRRKAEQEAAEQSLQDQADEVLEVIAVAGSGNGYPMSDADDEPEYEERPGSQKSDERGEAEQRDDEDVMEAEDDDEGDAEEEDAAVLPENPIADRRIDRVRPGDMFPGTRDSLFVEEEEQPSLAKSRKRRSRDDDERRPAANSSRKRRQFVPDAVQPGPSGPAPGVEDEDEQEQQDEEQAPDPRRFYGQWDNLLRAFKAVNHIGVNVVNGERQPRRKFKLKDAEVGTILNMCEEVIGKLKEGSDPAADFAAIAEKVDGLYQINTEGVEPDFGNEKRIKNIYSHLFPKLVEVLQQTIISYSTSDAQDERCPLTPGHLRTVKSLIEVILDLGAGATKYDPSPPSELAIVKPVKNRIIAPLKEVNAALSSVLRRQAWIEENKATQQREAEERALRLQREAQEERRAEHIRKLRMKWEGLHTERLRAECGAITNKKKLEHLAFPQPMTEWDGAGELFEREEIFTPRIGPPPALVEQAREQVWSMKELEALRDGLRKHAGPMVFEKVIREHCWKGGVLNRYNVTEIVTTAAWMRDYFTKKQEEEFGEAEQWLKDIPVWTSGHPHGKENEERDDNDDQDVHEGM